MEAVQAPSLGANEPQRVTLQGRTKRSSAGSSVGSLVGLARWRHGLAVMLLIASGWASRADAGVSLLNFQVGGIGVYPSGGSSQYSVQLAWTPYVGLGPIGLRGDFGVAFLKNVVGNRFMAVNTEALLSFSLLPAFSVEAGGGLQNWIDNGGTDLSFSANLVFSTLAMLDRIYVGYSRFFLAPGVNQLRFGIGFTF